MRWSTTPSKSSRVRFAALALALVLPASAYGQGATNPTFTRIQQGATVEGAVVTCGTSTTALLNCPTSSASAGDYRAVTCINDGSNKVFLCPTADCTCGASSQIVALAAGSAFTFGASSKSLRLACVASGGSTTVRCIAER